MPIKANTITMPERLSAILLRSSQQVMKITKPRISSVTHMARPSQSKLGLWYLLSVGKMNSVKNAIVNTKAARSEKPARFSWSIDSLKFIQISPLRHARLVSKGFPDPGAEAPNQPDCCLQFKRNARNAMFPVHVSSLCVFHAIFNMAKVPVQLYILYTILCIFVNIPLDL